MTDDRLAFARGHQVHRIEATGLGVVSALGIGCAAHWRAIAEGRSGIAPITRFSCEGFSSRLGATVAGIEPTAAAFAVVAAREAIAQARLSASELASPRSGFFLGATPTLVNGEAHDIARGIAAQLGIGGPVLCVSTACTSATIAFGLALDMLRAGLLDIVIAGGSDALAPETYAGFDRLGVVSAKPCAPFSGPVGMTPGEGAGFFVLERAADRARRGAEAVVELAGYGCSADAFHETAPTPNGEGVARALASALEDAGVEPGDVDYVNAHGTGTEQNDIAEMRGIRAALGAHAERVPVSASKSIFGHALAAAGALEAITTALALLEGAVPPTHNFSAPRAGAPTDPVAGASARTQAIRCAITTNSAFGGSNAALVLARVDRERRTERATEERAVSLHGVGVVAPFGVGEEARMAIGEGSMNGRTAAYAISDLVRTADPRGFDPAARHLTMAAQLALDDAHIRVRGPLRARAGIFVATPRVSAESDVEFRNSIRDDFSHVSVRAFARNVLNASAGSAAVALRLGGANVTLSSAAGGGPLALLCASLELRHRAANDVLMVAGLDEARAGVQADGCACLAVRVGPGTARVLGGAIGPRGATLAAARDAIVRWLDGREPDAIVEDSGGASASGSALSIARAFELIRSEKATTVVVVSAPTADVACAIVLSSEDRMRHGDD